MDGVPVVPFLVGVLVTEGHYFFLEVSVVGMPSIRAIWPATGRVKLRMDVHTGWARGARKGGIYGDFVDPPRHSLSVCGGREEVGVVVVIREDVGDPVP